jgi:hypothetical protein
VLGFQHSRGRRQDLPIEISSAVVRSSRTAQTV